MFEERFSFQKADVLSIAGGCTLHLVFFSTEMDIDFFALVFLLHSMGHHSPKPHLQLHIPEWTPDVQGTV